MKLRLIGNQYPAIPALPQHVKTTLVLITITITYIRPTKPPSRETSYKT